MVCFELVMSHFVKHLLYEHICICVQAEVRTSFEELYRVMSAREEFRWMMLRIKRMADPWVSAIRSLASKQNLVPRRRKKVGIEIKGGLEMTSQAVFVISKNTSLAAL